MICVHIYANIFWREHYRGQSGPGKKRMSIKVTIHLYSPSFRPDFSFNFNLKLSWHRHWLSSNQKKHFYCRIWTIELLPNPWIIRTKFSSTSDDIETRTKTSIKLVCFSSKQVSLFEIELSRQPKYRHPPFTFMLIIQEINFFFISCLLRYQYKPTCVYQLHSDFLDLSCILSTQTVQRDTLGSIFICFKRLSLDDKSFSRSDPCTMEPFLFSFLLG